MKTFRKSLFVLLIILVFNLAVGTIYVCAETAVPTENSNASPTPVLNIIDSFGDFALTANYSDNRVANENLAISATNKNINELSVKAIQAIRAQEGDKDIFAYFSLVLRMNGREIDSKDSMDIKIEKKSIFEKYQNITIFKVTEEGVYKIATDSDTDMIIFNITEMGEYVATGVLNPDASEQTEKPGNSSPTLQNSENTGIIPTSKPISSNKNNNESVITPGAFIFWLLTALVIGLWVGILVGYVLWGRYKTKKMQRGPYVIGE